MKDNRALLVETNQRRIKAALEEVHSAASRMDSGELKLFAKSQLGEAFLTCADLYGETQELLRSDFRQMVLPEGALGEKVRKQWERQQKEAAKAKTEWYMKQRLQKLDFDRNEHFDVFVYPLYGTSGTISLKSDNYKEQYEKMPYPTLEEAMYLLALLKPVPMYKVRDKGSQSIQSREYIEETMDDPEQERYTDFEEILPVWLEYKGSVPGHEEFIHVNWVTKIDGEAWRISVALRAHQYRNLIIRQYERRPTRGAMVVENVFYKFGDELYEIGRHHAIKWGRGTNDSVNELTLYWEED